MKEQIALAKLKAKQTNSIWFVAKNNDVYFETAHHWLKEDNANQVVSKMFVPIQIKTKHKGQKAALLKQANRSIEKTKVKVIELDFSLTVIGRFKTLHEVSNKGSKKEQRERMIRYLLK